MPTGAIAAMRPASSMTLGWANWKVGAKSRSLSCAETASVILGWPWFWAEWGSSAEKVGAVVGVPVGLGRGVEGEKGMAPNLLAAKPETTLMVPLVLGRCGDD